MGKSRFGQNFLVDRQVFQRIIDCVKLSGEDRVLEIGAGHGELTGLIVENAGDVVAVEMDKKLCGILRKKFFGVRNVRIIEGDILDINMKGLFPGKVMKVIGNLPYYITAPILMKLFGGKDCINTIAITVQKEVSDRMFAGPGSKTYGALSLAVQYHAEIETVFPVSRYSFYPQPEVDSCFVSLTVRRRAPVRLSDEEAFFSFIKGVFGGRRKMLYNTVLRAVSIDKNVAQRLLSDAGLDPKVRPENVSLEEFARIFAKIDGIRYPTTHVRSGD